MLHIIKIMGKCDSCVYCGLSTSHIRSVSRPYQSRLDMLMRLFHHFSRFHDQKYPKYIKADHDGRWSKRKYYSHDLMIKVWLLCVHYGLTTIFGVFLDHIRGVKTCLDDHFIILSGFMDQNIHKYMSKSNMMVKIQTLHRWSKRDSCMYITDFISCPGCF